MRQVQGMTWKRGRRQTGLGTSHMTRISSEDKLTRWGHYLINKLHTVSLQVTVWLRSIWPEASCRLQTFGYRLQCFKAPLKLNAWGVPWNVAKHVQIFTTCLWNSQKSFTVQKALCFLKITISKTFIWQLLNQFSNYIRSNHILNR